MNFTTQDILLIVYLIVNLIVFFIQREEIKKLKSIVSSIKEYVSIIDIKKLKEYADIREETIVNKSAILLADEESVKKIMDDSIDSKIKELTEIYLTQIKGQHLELISFAIDTLKHLDNEKQKEVIINNLPKCKEFLFKIMDDMNKNV